MSESVFKQGQEVYMEAEDDNECFKGHILKETKSFATVLFADGDIMCLKKSRISVKPRYRVDSYTDPNYKKLGELWLEEHK